MLKLDSDHQQQHELLKAILRNHFASDNAEILQTIQSEAEYIDLGPGETLLRQRDSSDDVYFVLSGRLRALSESEPDTSAILGEIGRGETIGELAMFTGEPRSASIIALRNSSVVKVTRAVIEAAISKQPQIALSMTRIDRAVSPQGARTPAAGRSGQCLHPADHARDGCRQIRRKPADGAGAERHAGCGHHAGRHRTQVRHRS
jgi:hypothetical protein